MIMHKSFIRIAKNIAIASYALLIPALITGCVPFPHGSNLTPGVAGLITSHGIPIVSTHMRLVSVSSEGSDPCSGEFYEFQTSPNGLFYAPPIREFNWFMYIMAHRDFPWTLCLDQHNQWASIYHETTYTLMDTGPMLLVEISCNEETEWKCKLKPNGSPSNEPIQ